jgi:hypothetical protein
MTYTTMPANAETKTVLLVGWEVKGVFTGPDHAELGAKVARLLNEDAARQQEENKDDESQCR